MSMQFSDELVYSKTISAHGNYKYLRIVPIGQGQNPALSLSSTTQTQFELPNNVLNLSRTKLSFDLVIPMQASLTMFNNVYANALSLIDRVTLTTRSGVILADIPNTHIFGNLISTTNTTLAELMTRTTLSAGVVTTQGSAASTNASGAHASTIATNATAPINSVLCPISDLVRCNGTVNYQASALALSAAAFTPNTEPAQIFVAPTVAFGNAISYQIELSAFKDTIMELNKNIYFGDNLVLTINWNSALKMGFTNDTASGSIHTNASDFTVPPLLSNLFLYTATETDPTIISQLVSSVNSGEFSIITPFVYCQKYASSSGTSNAMQQRINASYGSTLLRTYFGVFYNTETSSYAYSHNDSYLVDYNTYMDGLRLQDFTLKVSDSTHWLYNEKNFKSSCVQSLQQFKSSFVHIDNWCGTSPCLNDDSVLNGLSLDSDRTWSMQCNNHTTAAAYKFYLFYTTQKRLVISKGVIHLA
jgi:hypothetical protein